MFKGPSIRNDMGIEWSRDP